MPWVTAVEQIVGAVPAIVLSFGYPGRAENRAGNAGRRPPRVIGYGSVTNWPRNARACGVSSR